MDSARKCTHDPRPYTSVYPESELRQLQWRVTFFRELSEDVLRRAGVTRGTRVLDLGCGVGDTSLLIAKLVGPAGLVVGVDRSAEAIDVAQRRATVAGQCYWARFIAADPDTLVSDGLFDVVICRLISLDLSEPAAALRRLSAHVRPGGVIAFRNIGDADLNRWLLTDFHGRSVDAAKHDLPELRRARLSPSAAPSLTGDTYAAFVLADSIASNKRQSGSTRGGRHRRNSETRDSCRLMFGDKMMHTTIAMAGRKNIALVAHDNKKEELVEWAKLNCKLLAEHSLYSTGTTGRLLKNKLGLNVMLLECGLLGGDQQIGSRISEGQIDFLIFFSDPLKSQPHDPDVKALLRIAVVWNIPVACNRASADFIISSPLMSIGYERLVPDYSKYRARIAVARSNPLRTTQPTYLPHTADAARASP